MALRARRSTNTKVIATGKVGNGADKDRVTAQALTNAAAMSPAPLEIHFILAVLRWEDTPHRSKDYRCPSRAGCTGQLHRVYAECIATLSHSQGWLFTFILICVTKQV